MLAQVVGAPSSQLGELGPGVAGSTLAVVLLLVATLLVLRLAYGKKPGRARGGPLAVVAQVELSASQSLYLVRAADRCLLIGGTGAGLALIAELDPAQVAALGSAASAADAGSIAQRLRAWVFHRGSAELATLAGAAAGAEHAATRAPHGDLKGS